MTSVNEQIDLQKTRFYQDGFAKFRYEVDEKEIAILYCSQDNFAEFMPECISREEWLSLPLWDDDAQRGWEEYQASKNQI